MGLILRSDPRKQVVDVFTRLWQCVERLAATAAFGQYLVLHHVEIFEVQVSLLGVHKGKEAQLTRVGPKGHYVFSLELRKSLRS